MDAAKDEILPELAFRNMAYGHNIPEPLPRISSLSARCPQPPEERRRRAEIREGGSGRGSSRTGAPRSDRALAIAGTRVVGATPEEFVEQPQKKKTGAPHFLPRPPMGRRSTTSTRHATARQRLQQPPCYRLPKVTLFAADSTTFVLSTPADDLRAALHAVGAAHGVEGGAPRLGGQGGL